MNVKSIIASLIAFCLFLSNTGVSFGQDKNPAFRDIKGSFAEESINRLTQQGIIQGINSEQFAPGRNVTRLQFVVLIAKGLGVQPFFPTVPTFTDIPSGTVYAGYVEALANLGLIKGTKNKSFNGASLITRQDAAVIIRKAMDENTKPPFVKVKYNDLGRISQYAVDSVVYVTDKKLMNGSGGNFYPLKYLTRAEAAVLVDLVFKARKEQAFTSLVQPAGKLEIGTGEETGFENYTIDRPIAFTTVYGTDNQSVVSVSSKGTLVSGKTPGTGTITVNAGSNSYPVSVDVKTKDSGAGLLIDNIVSDHSERETTLPFSYKVIEQAPDEGFKSMEYKTYSGPVDGLASKGDTWTGFLRQKGRDIVIDLGAIKTVSEISMEFRHDSNSGVYLPKYISGSVSADGASWYQIGNVHHTVHPSDTTVQNRTFSLRLPSISTRYIKISFPVDIFVFLRHLTVTGGLPAEKPVILAAAESSQGLTGVYIQDSSMRDILLMFTGDKSEQQTLTEADFIPLAAYVNRQGEIKGRMFDTMLFLPANGLPCTSESWASYREDLFTPGKQLYALEEAMEKINNTTGIQVKQNVILALPYPDSKQLDFGSLGEAGESISFSTKSVDKELAAQNRLEAVQWYYAGLMDKWNSAGFKHLNLAGIYWYGELINPTVYGESELVQNVGRIVRGNGQKFFWIPYYGAPGYDNWKSYGFTHVFLQPNFYANQAPPEGRMDRAAELARLNMTGVELELDNRMLTSRYYYDLFYIELKKAHQLGLDGDTVTAYYTGLKKTLLDTVKSEIPEIRGIYDDLYRWINGTYAG